jgi:diaminohydroxyphosphoribosylaminopyrimidine deaminase/5-amino-6-(5-phosphoribosylamino)uracil reductase
VQVVVGVVDPNPQVGGKGIEHLKKHGIQVAGPCLEEQCYSLNEDFMQRMSGKDAPA